MLTVSQPAPSEPTVALPILLGLASFLEHAGISRTRLLQAAGIDATRLDAHEGRVPLSAVYATFESALELTGDPALGLHWGERGMSGLTFAPVSPLMAHAATLGQALDVLRRYSRLLSDQTGFEVVELREHVALRLIPPPASPRVRRLVAEFTMLGFFRVIRVHLPRAPQALPTQVHFDYAAPAHRAEYARMFGGSERFDQPHSEVLFDRVLLEAPSPHQDADVHEAMRTVADRRIAQLTSRVPFALRVRELLLREGAHRTDMKEVARRLGLSVRSLRRRLGGEGKSYNEIALEALALTAKRHLRDQRRSIQETAYEMGFSDTSTFHRAFKRWTGTTPSVFRDAELGRAR